MSDELGLPDFLNRKTNGMKPMPLVERQEWLATLPKATTQVDAAKARDKEIADAIEAEEIAERKRKAHARIAKLHAKRSDKELLRKLEAGELSWDSRSLRFVNRKARIAKKLAAARAKLGLE